MKLGRPDPPVLHSKRLAGDHIAPGEHLHPLGDSLDPILVPHLGTEFRINSQQWGLEMLDENFVTGRMAEACFSETSHLSKQDVEELRNRFRDEIGDYILAKASPLLSPQKLKELVVLAAESSARSYVVKRFCQFLHLLYLSEI